MRLYWQKQAHLVQKSSKPFAVFILVSKFIALKAHSFQTSILATQLLPICYSYFKLIYLFYALLFGNLLKIHHLGKTHSRKGFEFPFYLMMEEDTHMHAQTHTQFNDETLSYIWKITAGTDNNFEF